MSHPPPRRDPREPASTFGPPSLRPGEVVRWTGHADPAAFKRMPRLWAETVFGVLGVPFAALFYIGASEAAANAGAAMKFGVVPALSALAAASSLFLASVIPRLARRAARLRYTVTDQRVIIEEKHGDTVTTNTIEPAEFSSLSVTRRANGSGSVRLRSAPGQRAFRLFVDVIDLNHGLFGVPNIASAIPHIEALAGAMVKNAGTR